MYWCWLRLSQIQHTCGAVSIVCASAKFLYKYRNTQKLLINYSPGTKGSNSDISAREASEKILNPTIRVWRDESPDIWLDGGRKSPKIKPRVKHCFWHHICTRTNEFMLLLRRNNIMDMYKCSSCASLRLYAMRFLSRSGHNIGTLIIIASPWLRT